MGIARCFVRLVVLVGLIAGGFAVLPPSPASAGGVALTVTTTDDVVDDEDGVLSLREAVQETWPVDGYVSSIVLAEGAVYQLDDCSQEARWGELWLDLRGPFTLDGNGATIEQTCSNSLVLEAEVIGVEPADAPFSAQDLTLRTTGDGHQGLLVLSSPAALDGVTLTGAFGGTPAVLTAAPLVVSGSTFHELTGTGTVIYAYGGLDIEDSEITGSTGEQAILATGLRAHDVRLADNTVSDTLILPINQLELDGVVARGNTVESGLVLAGVRGFSHPAPVTPFVVRDSAFVNNTVIGGIGEDCCPVLGFQDAEAEISGTSVTFNRGFRFGVAAYVEDDEPQDLLVENSTVTSSGPVPSDLEGWGSTAVRGTGDLALRHVTAAGSNADTPWPVVEAPHLDSTATFVVATGAPSCDVGTTTSHGGNVSTDQTCGFLDADDREDVPDDTESWSFEIVDLYADLPAYQPVGANPGLDLLTDPGCGDDLPFDQIGRERPQGAGCDTGAVETIAPFSDVGPEHPFFADISWAASEGIAGGFDDGTFRPSLPVSRQAMAAFLYRLAGEPDVSVPSPPTFSDVSSSHPFFTEIEWLAGEGIAGGFGNGTFRPSLPVTRQAMAAFLYRRAGEPEVELPSPPTFSDVGAGHPFVTEIEWLQLESITEGYEDGTFRPASPVSRQAMAAFLHRVASD